MKDVNVPAYTHHICMHAPIEMESVSKHESMCSDVFVAREIVCAGGRDTQKKYNTEKVEV
jgi:hypothetical protein